MPFSSRFGSSDTPSSAPPANRQTGNRKSSNSVAHNPKNTSKKALPARRGALVSSGVNNTETAVLPAESRKASTSVLSSTNTNPTPQKVSAPVALTINQYDEKLLKAIDIYMGINATLVWLKQSMHYTQQTAYPYLDPSNRWVDQHVPREDGDDSHVDDVPAWRGVNGPVYKNIANSFQAWVEILKERKISHCNIDDVKTMEVADGQDDQEFISAETSVSLAMLRLSSLAERWDLKRYPNVRTGEDVDHTVGSALAGDTMEVIMNAYQAVIAWMPILLKGLEQWIKVGKVNDNTKQEQAKRFLIALDRYEQWGYIHRHTKATHETLLTAKDEARQASYECKRQIVVAQSELAELLGYMGTNRRDEKVNEDQKQKMAKYIAILQKRYNDQPTASMEVKKVYDDDLGTNLRDKMEERIAMLLQQCDDQQTAFTEAKKAYDAHIVYRRGFGKLGWPQLLLPSNVTDRSVFEPLLVDLLSDGACIGFTENIPCEPALLAVVQLWQSRFIQRTGIAAPQSHSDDKKIPDYSSIAAHIDVARWSVGEVYSTWLISIVPYKWLSYVWQPFVEAGDPTCRPMWWLGDKNNALSLSMYHTAITTRRWERKQPCKVPATDGKTDGQTGWTVRVNTDDHSSWGLRVYNDKWPLSDIRVATLQRHLPTSQEPANHKRVKDTMRYMQGRRKLVDAYIDAMQALQQMYVQSRGGHCNKIKPGARTTDIGAAFDAFVAEVVNVNDLKPSLVHRQPTEPTNPKPGDENESKLDELHESDAPKSTEPIKQKDSKTSNGPMDTTQRYTKYLTTITKHLVAVFKQVPCAASIDHIRSVMQMFMWWCDYPIYGHELMQHPQSAAFLSAYSYQQATIWVDTLNKWGANWHSTANRRLGPWMRHLYNYSNFHCRLTARESGVLIDSIETYLFTSDAQLQQMNYMTRWFNNFKSIRLEQVPRDKIYQRMLSDFMMTVMVIHGGYVDAQFRYAPTLARVSAVNRTDYDTKRNSGVKHALVQLLDNPSGLITNAKIRSGLTWGEYLIGSTGQGKRVYHRRLDIVRHLVKARMRGILVSKTEDGKPLQVGIIPNKVGFHVNTQVITPPNPTPKWVYNRIYRLSPTIAVNIQWLQAFAGELKANDQQLYSQEWKKGVDYKHYFETPSHPWFEHWKVSPVLASVLWVWAELSKNEILRNRAESEIIQAMDQKTSNVPNRSPTHCPCPRHMLIPSAKRWRPRIDTAMYGDELVRYQLEWGVGGAVHLVATNAVGDQSTSLRCRPSDVPVLEQMINQYSMLDFSLIQLDQSPPLREAQVTVAVDWAYAAAATYVTKNNLTLDGLATSIFRNQYYDSHNKTWFKLGDCSVDQKLDNVLSMWKAKSWSWLRDFRTARRLQITDPQISTVPSQSKYTGPCPLCSGTKTSNREHVWVTHFTLRHRLGETSVGAYHIKIREKVVNNFMEGMHAFVFHRECWGNIKANLIEMTSNDWFPSSHPPWYRTARPLPLLPPTTRLPLFIGMAPVLREWVVSLLLEQQLLCIKREFAPPYTGGKLGVDSSATDHKTDRSSSGLATKPSDGKETAQFSSDITNQSSETDVGDTDDPGSVLESEESGSDVDEDSGSDSGDGSNEFGSDDVSEVTVGDQTTHGRFKLSDDNHSRWVTTTDEYKSGLTQLATLAVESKSQPTEVSKLIQLVVWVLNEAILKQRQCFDASLIPYRDILPTQDANWLSSKFGYLTFYVKPMHIKQTKRIMEAVIPGFPVTLYSTPAKVAKDILSTHRLPHTESVMKDGGWKLLPGDVPLDIIEWTDILSNIVPWWRLELLIFNVEFLSQRRYLSFSQQWLDQYQNEMDAHAQWLIWGNPVLNSVTRKCLRTWDPYRKTDYFNSWLDHQNIYLPTRDNQVIVKVLPHTSQVPFFGDALATLQRIVYDFVYELGLKDGAVYGSLENPEWTMVVYKEPAFNQPGAGHSVRWLTWLENQTYGYRYKLTMVVFETIHVLDITPSVIIGGHPIIPMKVVKKLTKHDETTSVNEANGHNETNLGQERNSYHVVSKDGSSIIIETIARVNEYTHRIHIPLPTSYIEMQVTHSEFPDTDSDYPLHQSARDTNSDSSGVGSHTAPDVSVETGTATGTQPTYNQKHDSDATTSTVDIDYHTRVQKQLAPSDLDSKHAVDKSSDPRRDTGKNKQTNKHTK
jgi:hypothetical protein